MSYDAINWMLALPLESTPKHVLMVLANRANDDMKCWPSLALICADTGLSRSSVLRATRFLFETELVTSLGINPEGNTIFRLNVKAKPKFNQCRPDTKYQRDTSVKVKPVSPRHRSGVTVTQKPVSQRHPNQNKNNQQEPTLPAADAADSRHREFVGWAMKQHPDIAILPAHHKALQTLLKATRNKPAFTLDKLQSYWALFINSPDKFVRGQGMDVGWFCRNIGRFTRVNGNGHIEESREQAKVRRNIAAAEEAFDFMHGRTGGWSGSGDHEGKNDSLPPTARRLIRDAN